MPLGDMVYAALDTLGITPERVRRVFGDCCCEERKQRLNELDRWARRVLKGQVTGAVTYLNRILGSEE